MDQIVGQPHAIDVLQRQLASGRLHHAYIFHGPSGVGKFTTAVAFARVLLCHQRQTDLAGRIEPCGACESCRLLRERPADTPDTEAGDEPAAMAAAHPDLHVVTKELARYSDDRTVRERKLTSIPTGVLRSELIEPVHRATQLRHGKVFLVDEAELLNPTGQNLLLKTLEEPPPGTTLVLVTSSEDRLLPTIRSRCQRVAFVPFPDEAVQQWLDRHATDLLEQDRQWLLTFAAGSLGRARLALDYGLTSWAQTVLPALDQMAQGRPRGQLGQEIHEAIETFAKAWVDAHDGASKEAANKLAADLMGSLITSHARLRLAELAQRCDPADPAASETLLEPWVGVIDAVEQMHRLLATNVNMSIACDHLVTQMTKRLAPARA